MGLFRGVWCGEQLSAEPPGKFFRGGNHAGDPPHRPRAAENEHGLVREAVAAIDSGHAGEGVLALVEELKVYRGRKIKLLFAVMSDKDWQLMLARLSEVVSQVMFTKVAMERSADPAELAQNFAGKVASRSHADARAALRLLIDESAAEDVIVVAGSLYLLGEIRPMLQEIAAARSQFIS